MENEKIDLSELDDVLTGVASDVYDRNVGETGGEEKKDGETEEKTSEGMATEEVSNASGSEEVSKEEEKIEETKEGEGKEMAKAGEDGEKSLQELLDSLMKQDEKVEDKQEQVEEQVKKVEEAAKSEDSSGLQDEVRKLKEAITEKDMEVDKYKKLADMLREQYDKIVKENVQLKYGGGTDGAVLDVINSDDNIRSLVAYKTKYMEDPSDENKQKLIGVVKSMYEDLTGASLDSLVQQQKTKEMNAFIPQEEGNAMNSKTSSSGIEDFNDILT